MPDSRQGVVLAEHGDLRSLGARPGLECRFDPVGATGRCEPLLLEDIGQDPVGMVLLVAEFRVRMDVVGGGEEEVGEFVDVRADPRLGGLGDVSVVGHGRMVPKPPPGGCIRGRSLRRRSGAPRPRGARIAAGRFRCAARPARWGWPLEVDLFRPGPRVADPGMRNVCAAGQAPPGAEPLPGGKVGVEDVQQSVARMCPGGDVPVPEVGGVRGDPGPTPEPGTTCHEVGTEPVQPPIQEGRSEVNAEPLSLFASPTLDPR